VKEQGGEEESVVVREEYIAVCESSYRQEKAGQNQAGRQQR